MKDQFYIISTTLPNIEVAKSISNTLISNKLAMCINIKEINSIYLWEGKIEDSKEFSLSIKTSTTKLEKAKKLILSLHPYKVPALYAIEATSLNRDFYEWIESK